jgi:RNA polymerase sigma factor (sigma-70 family)
VQGSRRSSILPLQAKVAEVVGRGNVRRDRVRSRRPQAQTSKECGARRRNFPPAVAGQEPQIEPSQIEPYMGEVSQIARSLWSRLPAGTAELEELEADGFEALVRAVRDYDPSKGPLAHYVVVRCRGAMIDGLRRKMLSTRTQRANGVAEPVVLSLEHEVAEDLRIDELVADPEATTAEDVIESVSTADVCSELAELPRKHRRILFARFIQRRSQSEVAAAEGVSRKTIAQCETRVRRLRKLGESIEERPLTANELKVLRLAAEGATSAESARRLRKASETVKSQRRAIIAKLRARNIINAVAIGYQRGLLR